jgi:hypothetical protein
MKIKKEKSEIKNQIHKYIQDEYRGGKIGISKLAQFCKVREGQLIPPLREMEADGYLEISKRYYCPESHFLHCAPSTLYCDECAIDYHPDQILIRVYIKPLQYQTMPNEGTLKK